MSRTGAAAELSSLSSTLDQVLQRVTALVERDADGVRGDEPDEVAVALYEVERALQEARRRLERVVELAGRR